jgi:MFS family permease
MKLKPITLMSRNFQLLLASKVISGLGSQIAAVAVPFAVIAIHGSVADVGYVSASSLVTTMLCLLFGGVVADRVPRHHIIIASDGFQFLVQAVTAALILNHHAQVWELIVQAAFRGAALGFYMPAAQGLLSQTVSSDQLSQANAISSLGSNTAQIGGAALGGIIVGLVGPGWGLAADSVSFAAAGLLRIWMRFPALPPESRKPILHELHEGWRELMARRWLYAVIVQFSGVSAIAIGTLTVLGPIVADRHFDGAKSWGIIMASYAAGSILSGTVMIKFRFRRMLMAGLLTGQAFALLLFALAVPLVVPLTAAAAFIGGAGAQVFEINWATAMQHEIPLAMLSRLSSFDMLGSMAFAPIGAVAAGLLASAYGPAAVLTVGGVLILLFTLIVLTVPDVRHLQQRRPEHASEGDSGP